MKPPHRVYATLQDLARAAVKEFGGQSALARRLSERYPHLGKLGPQRIENLVKRRGKPATFSELTPFIAEMMGLSQAWQPGQAQKDAVVIRETHPVQAGILPDLTANRVSSSPEPYRLVSPDPAAVRLALELGGVVLTPEGIRAIIAFSYLGGDRRAFYLERLEAEAAALRRPANGGDAGKDAQVLPMKTPPKRPGK